MSTAYTVGLTDLSLWRPQGQLDGSADQNFQCSQTCLAMFSEYAGSVAKTAAQVHDEYWQSYVGPVDIPAIQVYAKSALKTTFTPYYADTVQGLARVIYQALFYQRLPMWYATLDGQQGHWEMCLQMSAADGHVNPFDNLKRSDPWFGQMVDTSWMTFTQMCKRYYVNNQYVILVPDRVRAIAYESRMAS